jgi:hypothetical protein
VAAATNRDQKAEFGGEIDGIHNIGQTAASGDQCRPFVDQPVVDLSRLLVARVSRLEELSSEGSGKIGGCASNRCDRRHNLVSSH